MAVSALEKQEQNRQKQIQIREACEELDVSPPSPPLCGSMPLAPLPLVALGLSLEQGDPAMGTRGSLPYAH